MKLYTVGYNDWTPDQLHRAAQQLGAVVVDIRYNPTSRKPEWKQQALQRVLGDRYLHVKALGNVNYKSGGEIELYRPDAGVEAVESIIGRGKSVILMCVCRNLATCHRYDAALWVSACLELNYRASEGELQPSDYEAKGSEQLRLW